MGGKKRSQRHHTVPRFHLRGFASEDGLLRQVDLRTGTRRSVSISDASVVKNFYTVELDDGKRSDLWEQRFADVESRVAPLVRAAVRATSWSPTDAERSSLAVWIALQVMRGTAHRRSAAQTKAMMLTMQVGMGGLAYLRHAMSEGLGRDVSRPEALAVWEDLHQPGGPNMELTGQEFMDSIQFSIRKVGDHIMSRSWHRVRFSRKTLAVNDTPVALIPADDHPEFLAVGLANAGAITIALNRHTLLWLDSPAYPDGDLPGSASIANMHNRNVVLGADRFVYTHPDDDDPADGLTFPVPERRMEQPDNLTSFSNIDRPLDDVLKQIAERGDEDDPNSMIADYAWPIAGYRAPAAPSDGDAA
jgi:hypothetical protein